MRTLGRLRAPRWLLLVLGVVIVAGHGVVLHYASSRTAVPAAVLAGMAVVLVLKHLGLVAALRGFLRRRSQR